MVIDSVGDDLSVRGSGRRRGSTIRGWLDEWIFLHFYCCCGCCCSYVAQLSLDIYPRLAEVLNPPLLDQYRDVYRRLLFVVLNQATLSPVDWIAAVCDPENPRRQFREHLYEVLHSIYLMTGDTALSMLFQDLSGLLQSYADEPRTGSRMVISLWTARSLIKEGWTLVMGLRFVEPPVLWICSRWRRVYTCCIRCS